MIFGEDLPRTAQTVAIRAERPGDEAAIRAVHESAFGGAAEANLVERLRAASDIILSLVALEGGMLGHAAFSRLRAESADRPVRAVALAPVGVVARRQSQGIGAALVRTGLELLERRGEELVLVLGDPAYYRRFGFTRDAAERLSTPYDGPHLMALTLGQAPAPPEGTVLRYPAAFASLA